MLGQQLGTILARTDPFDIAQGLERHIRSLSGERVRQLITTAQGRMNEWYRAEFLPLLEERDDERLKNAFSNTLKSNLRAIPMFGPTFCEGVISETPGDRAVGLGEESSSRQRFRPAAFAVMALTLVLGGAAAEHIFSDARATSQTPAVTITPQPPPPRPVRPIGVAVPPRRHVSSSMPRRQASRPYVPSNSNSAALAVEPVVPWHEPPPSVRRTVPPGAGVKTITVSAATPQPSPSPSDIDVSDMPQAYTDATPLPQGETAPPAQAAAAEKLATPTPRPRKSWLHRAVMHLDPFKSRDNPSPAPRR